MNKRSIAGLLILALSLVLVFTQVSAAPPVTTSGKTGLKTDRTATLDMKKEDPTSKKKPQKEPSPAAKKINIKGNVVSFDGSNLVMKVKNDGEVSILVNEDTLIKSIEGKTTPQAGDPAVVRALRNDDSTFTAIVIHLLPSKPTKLHHVGEVTAYEPGASITVTNKKGESTTFQVTADTVLLPADRAEALQVGSWVTVIVPRNSESGAKLVAMKIVIHPEKK